MTYGFGGVAAGGGAGGLLKVESSTGELTLISVYLRVAVDPASSVKMRIVNGTFTPSTP